MGVSDEGVWYPRPLDMSSLHAYILAVTTVEITLSDEVARNAAAAGLLAPERLDELFRAQLRKEAGAQLMAMTADIRALPGAPMTLDEIGAHVDAVRGEISERSGAVQANHR